MNAFRLGLWLATVAVAFVDFESRVKAETNQFVTNGITGAATGTSTNAVRTFRGELRAGVMAIGGESTGFQLRAADGIYELRGDEKLQKQMTELSGKKVAVRGALTIRKGVEKPVRKIIAVESVKLDAEK